MKIKLLKIIRKKYNIFIYKDDLFCYRLISKNYKERHFLENNASSWLYFLFYYNVIMDNIFFSIFDKFKKTRIIRKNRKEYFKEINKRK